MFYFGKRCYRLNGTAKKVKTNNVADSEAGKAWKLQQPNPKAYSIARLRADQFNAFPVLTTAWAELLLTVVAGSCGDKLRAPRKHRNFEKWF